ncbi:unnamed protein product [Linum trigynum]|uniref:Uncharacterized protein n=1 Tax=Linum trigynum TaxID=586398 RepID=A0AAV2FS80_9ROSI
MRLGIPSVYYSFPFILTRICGFRSIGLIEGRTIIIETSSLTETSMEVILSPRWFYLSISFLCPLLSKPVFSSLIHGFCLMPLRTIMDFVVDYHHELRSDVTGFR